MVATPQLSHYAVPGTPLAALVPPVKAAITRALAVRASDIQPPGGWIRGVSLPRRDGGFQANLPIPNKGARLLWVGGNGP